MYYIISLIIYIILLLILCVVYFAFIKNDRISGKEAADEGTNTLAIEMAKAQSKSDLKSRKERVKVLPLYQRFLYWFWFFSTISFFLVLPAALAISRGIVMKDLYVPDTSIYFTDNKFSLIAIFFMGMLFGTSLSIGFSYITYTKTIAKADSLYAMGSFQVYPKKFNFAIAFVAVVVMFPLLFFSYNNYQYLTKDEIALKPVFAFSEKTYPYSDIEQIERKIYTDGEESIIAHMNSGKKIELYSGDIESDMPELYRIIDSYDFPTFETRVLSLPDKIRSLF